MNDTDLLPPDLHQLIQLFTGLPDVRFPDLDAAAMHDAVARLKERHLELLHVEAQLAAMRTALEEDQDALLKKGHRLLAYLKVFAEADEQLAVRLETLALPRLRKPAAPKVATPEQQSAAPTEGAPAPRKRGRPRKVPVASDGLFAEAPMAEAAPSIS